MIAVTRRYRLTASHVLRREDFSEEENCRVFGKCANPHGHGHDYGLEITVAGPVDPATGRVIEPGRLDAIVRERVLERLDHRMLNDDPAFREAIPTTENLVAFLRDALAEPIASAGPGRLHEVHVVETRKNAFGWEEGR